MCIWLEVNSFKRSTSTPSNNRELPTIRTEVGWPGVAGCILTASDRKSTRLNSSHSQISYAVFCLKKKNYRLEPEDPISDPRDTVTQRDRSGCKLVAHFPRPPTHCTDLCHVRLCQPCHSRQSDAAP